jgi:hypothetical protein
MYDRLALCTMAAATGDRAAAALLVAGLPTASERLAAVAWLTSAATVLNGVVERTTPAGRVAGRLMEAVRSNDPEVGELMRAVVALPADAVGAVGAAAACACANGLGTTSLPAAQRMFTDAHPVGPANIYLDWVDRRTRLLSPSENTVLALTAAASAEIDHGLLDDLVRLTVADRSPYAAAVEEIADGLAAIAGGMLSQAAGFGFAPEARNDLTGVAVALRLAQAAHAGDARTLWGVRAAYLGTAGIDDCVDLLHAQATLSAHLALSLAEATGTTWVEILDDQIAYPLDAELADGPATARHRAGLAALAALAADTQAASRLSRNLLGDDPARRGACTMLCSAYLDVSAGVGRDPAAALAWLRGRHEELDVAADQIESTIERRPYITVTPASEVGAVLQLGAALAAVATEAADRAGQDPIAVVSRVLDERNRTW